MSIYFGFNLKHFEQKWVNNCSTLSKRTFSFDPMLQNQSLWSKEFKQFYDIQDNKNYWSGIYPNYTKDRFSSFLQQLQIQTNVKYKALNLMSNE